VDLLQFFVGLEGRVGRIGYAIPLALIVFTSTVIVATATVVALRDGGPLPVMAAVGVLVLIVPWVAFAMTWKRLHDVGVSGIYAFMLFVPVVALLMVAVLCLLPGDAEPNQFGEPEPV